MLLCWPLLGLFALAALAIERFAVRLLTMEQQVGCGLVVLRCPHCCSGRRLRGIGATGGTFSCCA